MSDFLVPDLGEGLDEATVSSWAVTVGDDVELNQILCTLETAKAEVEIPSPYAGRVDELGGAVGDVLAVGKLLVRIDTGTANGQGRTPVLVGYGADADLDTVRRPRPRAKPAVRKLAADLLVDLTTVTPDTDGLVSRDAVLAAAGVCDTQRPGITGDVTPVRGVQAEMARRMSMSRHEIPDAHAAVTVDGTRLLELGHALGIGTFALTARMLVLALTHHAVLNACWVDGPDGPQIHTHHGVHLGIAAATPRGLLVPVLRDAHSMSTRELAERAEQLIATAREGRLGPADLTGSTFTVSNFGALGLDDGVPVINHPEVAILGMGSLRPRAVVIDGVVTARSTMTMTCAFDHRVADGAQVAAFLTELRGLIETPETALVHL